MFSRNQAIRYHKKSCRNISGFTLIEIILTLLVAAVLGTMLYTYLRTPVEQSGTPLYRLQSAMSLQKIMENITREFESNRGTPGWTLENLRANIDTADRYGTNYSVVKNEYIQFVSGNEQSDSAATGNEDILKVTIQNSLGERLTKLFTLPTATGASSSSTSSSTSSSSSSTSTTTVIPSTSTSTIPSSSTSSSTTSTTTTAATTSTTTTVEPTGQNFDGSKNSDDITGTDGPDNINGNNGSDTIYGLGGDDTINGGNHNDNIWGGPGNDTLDGGNHDDTVSYPGPLSDYNYCQNTDGSITITDLTGAEGTDTLYNFETIRFLDGTYNINPGSLGDCP